MTDLISKAELIRALSSIKRSAFGSDYNYALDCAITLVEGMGTTGGGWGGGSHSGVNNSGSGQMKRFIVK